MLNVCRDIEISTIASSAGWDFTALIASINGGFVDFAKLLLHPPDSDFIQYIPYNHDFGDVESSKKIRRVVDITGKNFKIVRVGANTNQKTNVNYKETTPLQQCNNYNKYTVSRDPLAQNRIKIGGYLNSYLNKPLLHGAASENKYDIMKRLIKQGFDVNVKNSRDQTAIEIAASTNQKEAASYLFIFGAKIGNGTSRARLEFAKEHDLLQTIFDMLIKGSEYDLNAMKSFTLLGDVSMLKYVQ